MHETDPVNNEGGAEGTAETPKHRYKPLSFPFLRSKDQLRANYKERAAASPSLRVFEPTISSKITAFSVPLFAAQRRVFLILIALFVAYILIISFTIGLGNITRFYEFYLTGAAIIYVIFFALLWMVLRSRQEGLAMLYLFSTTCFLEANPTQWPNSKFRWRIARRLEAIARRIERIPLASRALALTVKSEALKMGRTKAQAIRQLELWAIRPMAFTFTDLVEQLTSDLCKMVDDRWYDLPEADDFGVKPSKWFYIVRLGGAVLIIGVTIVLITFATKLGSAASILAVILPALAVALLNSAGISTSVIDRYIQTGSRMTPSK
jgi:hypothetical protein